MKIRNEKTLEQIMKIKLNRNALDYMRKRINSAEILDNFSPEEIQMFNDIMKIGLRFYIHGLELTLARHSKQEH